MTRINLVDPVLLTDQHLFAEYREIKMVPAALKRSLKTKDAETVLSRIPGSFVLGAGHVSFFYDKLEYLGIRYNLLCEELINRGYRKGLDWPEWQKYVDGIPGLFYNNYVPSTTDLSTIQTRIAFKIKLDPEWYRYYGVSIVKNEEVYRKVLFIGDIA